MTQSPPAVEHDPVGIAPLAETDYDVYLPTIASPASVDGPTEIRRFHDTPLSLDEHIARYRPRRAPYWDELQGIVIDAATRTNSQSWKVIEPTLKACYDFIVWATRIAGIDMELEELFTGRNIHLWIQRREHRGRGGQERRDLGFLGRVVEAVQGERPSRMHINLRSDATPYSDREIAALGSFADNLRTKRMRTVARGVIALGLGVGLRPVEFDLLRGQDISDDTVRIEGDRARSIPIRPEYLAEIGALRGCGDDFVLLPHISRDDRNRGVVRSFIDDLDRGRPSLYRLRSTYLIEVLRRGISVTAFMSISGFTSLGSADRYLAQIPPPEGAATQSELARIFPTR